MDGRFDELQRPSTAAALGTVAHRLDETAASGAFDQVPTEGLERSLADAWDAEVARAHASLRERFPLEPPEPRRWHGYGPIRRRALRRLAERLDAQRPVSGDPDREGGPVVAEVKLEHPSLPLQGRVDRVEHTAAGTRIVDIKSGWAPTDEMSPSHRRQLLFYAFLWHANEGDWPVSAAIQRLDGTRLEVDVDSIEAEEVAHEALSLRERFNVAASGDAWQLATPSADACAHCDFRPLCVPYFRELSRDWRVFRRSVVGAVESVTRGETTATVEIRALATNVGDATTAVVRVAGLLPEQWPREQAIVAVVDALPTNRPDVIRVAWDSYIVDWSSAYD